MKQQAAIQPLISVRNLEARYGDKVILKNVDVDIYPNEITVILGSSGCGKTTLLKNILRLQEPVSGEVFIWGEDVLKMDDHAFQKVLRQVGMLFQGGALMNSISVYDNIAIPLEQHTKLSARIRDRIIRLKLHLVKLDNALYLNPSELSGGMKKRVALARAMVLDPKILFCDEPSAGLDPLTSAALDSLIVNLKQQLNMTIVVVTHELASIHRIADRIIFLDSGSVLYQGTLDGAKQAHIPAIDTFFASGKYD
jgi:phospholipid/cholesterol/gamma-HCH transport system ATP-binding protein